MNLDASNPVASLKSEFNREILLLSSALKLLNFFGLLPYTIRLVLWLREGISPSWIEVTTWWSGSPSMSQCSLYNREVIPSVPGAALRLDSNYDCIV